jgi:rare lipoprotein A
MDRRRESSNTSPKSWLRTWLLVGAVAIDLAAGGVAVCPRAVLADALLSRPAATAPLAVPVASATPASLAQAKLSETTKASVFRGVASWYGGVFNGRLTASGERFDMNAMTACHRTLPFGSLVRVVDLDNQRSVVVRITDRGHLYEGRILDLSYGAARKLGIVKPGFASVKLEVLSLGGSHRDQ